MKRYLNIFLGFTLFCTVLLFFMRGATDGHLSLDDAGYTCACHFVKDGLSFSNIYSAFTTLNHGGIWMPFTYITYMADISLWGGGWKVHHITNITLHALTAIIVFIFLLELTKRITKKENITASVLCFIATLLWAMHPMRSEAVIWIASRKEELWTLFSLLSLIMWMKFLDQEQRVFYIGSLIFLLFSSLSKPTAMCVPLLALLLQFILCTNEKKRPRFFLYHIPFFLISLIIGIIAIYSQSNPSGLQQIDLLDTTFLWRIRNAIVSLGLYIYNTFYPTSIHIDYRAVFNGTPVRESLSLLVLLFFAAFSVCMLFWQKTRKAYALVTIWYLISIFPVLGLLGGIGNNAFADRYAYMPSIILSFAFILIALNLSTSKINKSIIICISGLLITTEIIFAKTVIDSYKTDYTAYSRVLNFDQNHWRAYRMVGIAHVNSGQLDSGIKMLETSIKKQSELEKLGNGNKANISYLTIDYLITSLGLRGNDNDIDTIQQICVQLKKTSNNAYKGIIQKASRIIATHEIKKIESALKMLKHEHLTLAQKVDEEINTLEKSLKQRPRKITADILAFSLACRGKDGDFNKVKQICAQVIKNPQKDPRGMMLEALGIVAMREKNDTQAMQYFTQAINAPQRNYPNIHTILFLGISYINCERRFNAIETLGQLKDINDTAIKNRAIKALEHMRLRDKRRLEWQPL